MNNYSNKVERFKNGPGFEKRRCKATDTIVSSFNGNTNGLNNLERAIVKESDQEVLAYISGHLNPKLSYKSIILTTSTSSYIDDVDFDNVRAIINLEPTNHSRNADKLLWAVNTILPDAGIYIGLFHALSHTETLGVILTKYGFDIIDLKVINGISYFVAIKTCDSVRRN
jgi:hypothetical protein